MRPTELGTSVFKPRLRARHKRRRKHAFDEHSDGLSPTHSGWNLPKHYWSTQRTPPTCTGTLTYHERGIKLIQTSLIHCCAR